MKITKHIAFFYREDRLNYLSQMIQAANTYPFPTDIFIHTNIIFDTNVLTLPTNGGVFLIGHDLSNKDPLNLPCYVRPLMKAQQAAYDIFIYTEDDILIPKEAINYWLAYKDTCIRNTCNLGFLRIETDKEGKEYLSDLHNEHSVSQQLTKVGKLEDLVIAINDVNPYVAFWIYDQSEFKRFTESYLWDPASLVPAYDIRAAAAIGMHQIRLEKKLYLATVIPLTEQLKPLPACRVYHLPSNYAEMPYCFFATLYFDETVWYDNTSFRHPNMVIQRKHERLFNAHTQSKQQPPLT